MNTGLLIIIVIIIALFYLHCTESFVVGDSYLHRNYESGANMLRGDLPIDPVNQSWFNSSISPETSYVQGYFNT